MTRNEVVVMFKMINQYYSRSFLDCNNEAQVNAWTKMLQDIDLKIALYALEQIVQNEKYEPSIATIRKYCSTIQNGRLTDTNEAWGMVIKKVNELGYMRAEEALKSLPSEVAQAVNYMGGWLAVCTIPDDEKETARAQFRRCMESINSRKQEERNTSSNLLLGISQIQEANRTMIEVKEEVAKDEAIKDRSKLENDFQSVANVLKELGLRK